MNHGLFYVDVGNNTRSFIHIFFINNIAVRIVELIYKLYYQLSMLECHFVTDSTCTLFINITRIKTL
jgi:hypothetical protein